MSETLRELARTANAWPFQEANALLSERLKGGKPAKGFTLFESGYGPSGLPHIGTFGEVARTTMVRRAFDCWRPRSRPSSTPSPTIVTACARCRTTSPTGIWSDSIWASR